MPTIEIISVDCPEIPELPAFRSFSFEAESVLQSHRGLFQSRFNEVSGVIVHLGNKRADGKFGGSAGNLIDWEEHQTLILPEADDTWNGDNQISEFRFISSIFGDLRALIIILMESSPRKEVWFSTDIQFGPSRISEENTTLDRFFQQMESSVLFWHRLYRIRNWRVSILRTEE
jgi:hypothetical protein